MAGVAKVQKDDFSIIIFEHPKNLRTIWNALEKHWKYRNTITWHVPNRVQGFSAKYKFFNKQDIFSKTHIFLIPVIDEKAELIDVIESYS
jgi:DNA modification methylase